MGTVEPIRELKNVRKIERLLARQSERDLLLFTLGINCGLRISDIKTHEQLKLLGFKINLKTSSKVLKIIKTLNKNM